MFWNRDQTARDYAAVIIIVTGEVYNISEGE
jgi:hypothetical protein